MSEKTFHPFVIHDGHGIGVVDGHVMLDEMLLETRVGGYGTCGMQPGCSGIAYLELWEGELRLVVFADITREDPTHIIPLNGAREQHRKIDPADDNNMTFTDMPPAAYGQFVSGQRRVRFCYRIPAGVEICEELEDALWENVENSVNVAYYQDSTKMTGELGCCYDHPDSRDMTEIPGTWTAAPL